MKSFLAAIQFLTVIPFPKTLVTGERELEKSVPFFPVVGLLIGMMAAILGYVMDSLLPPFPACVVVVIFLLAVSGGLHMDGLADAADGFFSARPLAGIKTMFPFSNSLKISSALATGFIAAFL